MVSYIVMRSDRFDSEVRDEVGAALRFLLFNVRAPSVHSTCGVLRPESSRVVASVKDPALLGVNVAFLASSSAAVSSAFCSMYSLYCASICVAILLQNALASESPR